MQGLPSRNAGPSESLDALDPSQARQGIQKHLQVTQQEAESSLVTVTGTL